MAFKIQVTIKPNARHTKVEKISDTVYKVSVKSPAKEGKANQELLKVLAKYFSVAKSDVIICSGMTSRKKIIEVG